MVFTRRARRFVLLGATAGACLLIGPAQGALPPSLTIVPSIIEARIKPDSYLKPITLQNGTKTTFRIFWYPAHVDQRLDGSLVIREKKKDLAAARRRFYLSPQRFVIAPGQTKTLRVLFIKPAPATPSANLAGVVEATPVVKRGTRPQYRLRLLSALLVDVPEAPQPRGRFVKVFAVRNGARYIRLVARIRDTSQVHGYVRNVQLRLRGPAGKVLFTAFPTGGFLLPHYERDFRGAILLKLRPGVYRVEASGFFGGVRMAPMSSKFTVKKPK